MSSMCWSSTRKRCSPSRVRTRASFSTVSPRPLKKPRHSLMVSVSHGHLILTAHLCTIPGGEEEEEEDGAEEDTDENQPKYNKLTMPGM